jgi:glycosyltransferase involved in cell wall biosynthesis
MITASPVDQKKGNQANPPRPALRWRLFKTRLLEWLMHDARAFQATVAFAAVVAGWLLYWCRQTRRSFDILAKLHRANYFTWADASARRIVRTAAQQRPQHPLMAVYRDYVASLTPLAVSGKYFRDPSLLFPYFAMVLKSPRANEKGVLVLEYNYIFPVFAKFFNIEEIARRYHLVLEPTWSGYCTLEVLSYCQYSFPVFVQAFEPRDAELLTGMKSNLIPVPTSTNWWVDHRMFRPIPRTTRDIDVVMIAAWAPYKRHHRFFRALAKLRQQGNRLRVLLLGYQIHLKKEDILEQACYYGVLDQVEIHEKVPYHEVNEHLNRAKVNIIWSRKEGVNRAIVEGMFAGVPCLVRAGFNYGHHYEYINERTGCFASEYDLPAKLLGLIRNHARFSPRDWVMANMSCQRATEILAQRIRSQAIIGGETWTESLAVKTNELNGMVYWNPQDNKRFENDYVWLRTQIRT